SLLLSGLIALLLTLRSLLPLLLATLVLTLARFHSATQRLEIVGKLASAVERVFKALALRLPISTTFGGLKIFEHLFEIALYYSLALTRLIEPAVGDHLLVLSNTIGYAILPYGSCGFAQLVARLLLLLAEPARRLVDVTLETRNLVGKRFFPFGD